MEPLLPKIVRKGLGNANRVSNVIPNRVDRPIDPLTSSKFITRSTRNYSSNHHATKTAYFKPKLGGARGEALTCNIRAEKA
jgi:hypothetical protein